MRALGQFQRGIGLAFEDLALGDAGVDRQRILFGADVREVRLGLLEEAERCIRAAGPQGRAAQERRARAEKTPVLRRAPLRQRVAQQAFGFGEFAEVDLDLGNVEMRDGRTDYVADLLAGEPLGKFGEARDVDEPGTGGGVTSSASGT